MSERLKRPEAMGNGFITDLAYALDNLGVKPGDEFYVTVTAGEARARNSDPGTSHAAAKSVGDLRESQRAVLSMFETWGEMIDESLCERYSGAAEAGRIPPQEDSGIRTRRRELVDAGLLVDTGRKGKNDHGRDAILWGIPEKPKPDVAGGGNLFEMPPASPPKRHQYAEEF